MWAGIKHAINDTLGTQDFKSINQLLDNAEKRIRIQAYDSYYFMMKNSVPKEETHIYDYSIISLSEPRYSAGNQNTTTKNIILPSTCIELGWQCLSFYTNVNAIILPPSLMKIGSRAFFACSNIESIRLPKFLKEMDMNALNGMTNLKYIFCEFSENYAIEKLTYFEDYKWGVSSASVVFEG